MVLKSRYNFLDVFVFSRVFVLLFSFDRCDFTDTSVPFCALVNDFDPRSNCNPNFQTQNLENGAFSYQNDNSNS